MRKILISKKNEFTYNNQVTESRALAVKMFANLIKTYEKPNKEQGSIVSVSNKAIKRN